MNQPAVSPPPSAPAAAPPLLFVLLDAAHRLDARVEADLAKIGLSPGKAQVLEALAGSSRPMPLSEIALCNRCVRSNITQLVDRLEADGLVRRVNDPTDSPSGVGGRGALGGRGAPPPPPRGCAAPTLPRGGKPPPGAGLPTGGGE